MLDFKSHDSLFEPKIMTYVLFGVVCYNIRFFFVPNTSLFSIQPVVRQQWFTIKLIIRYGCSSWQRWVYKSCNRKYYSSPNDKKHWNFHKQYPYIFISCVNIWKRGLNKSTKSCMWKNPYNTTYYHFIVESNELREPPILIISMPHL